MQDRALTTSWLAAKLGTQSGRIEAMRRGGQLYATRRPGEQEYLYPAWQFSDGEPRRVVSRIVTAARERGLSEERLYDLLTMRAGLARRGGSERRLADLIADGEDDQVVAAVRAAS